jgi:beta-xylosidase
LIEAGKGLIDPCPLWDADGKAYLVHAYAGSRAGIKSVIVVKEMNKEGTKIMGDGVMIYDGHENDPTIEGPKFYKRNGYYYIFAPAGGVSTGWQTILRSKNVYGPYERKVVLDQGTTSINGPHQGAWVTTQTGEDWFLHFQDKNAYGRGVHLQPMKWINDWPGIGIDKDGDGKGEPVLSYKKPTIGKQYSRSTVQDGDEFNETKFGLQWQWQANPKEGWAYTTPNGSLRMFSVYQSDSIKNLWSLPNILGQKFPADEFSATVKVFFKPKFENERFGLIIIGSDYASLSIVKRKDALYIVQSENIAADKNGFEKEIASYQVNGNEFNLQVVVSKDGVCVFGYGTNDGARQLGKSFVAKPGRWVGAKIGVFCTRTNITNDAGFADIDWIHFEAVK